MMLSIPILNLKRLHAPLFTTFQSAVKDLFTQSDYIKGKAVESFENHLSNYLKVPYVVSCGNGTDALFIACLALELKKGDTVIMPAFNYISCAEVAQLIGLRVIYVDTDPKTYHADLSQLEYLTEIYQPKVIFTVSLFGLAVQRENIYTMAQKYGSLVIEDQAQSIGAMSYIEKIDAFSCHYADISTTSFFPTKNLGGLGDGGALYTHREDLYLKIKAIANHGQYAKYNHTFVGVNSRLDTIQAYFLLEKLKMLNDHNNKRQGIAKIFDSGFDNLSFTLPYNQVDTTHHIYHQYTIRVSSTVRDKLQVYLKEKGIQSMIYYPKPVYRQPAYVDTLNQVVECLQTERICSEVLSLPICPSLTIEEVDYIVYNMKKFESIV